MESAFKETLKRLVGKTEGKRYVLAVSGGADSMALLSLALSALEPSQLIVAHFDHGTRGVESAKDALFVKEQVKRLGIAFFEGKRQGEKTSEAALRSERRKFLRRVASQGNADFIMTAHHLDDQLETFFFRLIRGTGLPGLSSMKPLRGMWLKPLLEYSRDSLRKYVEEKGILFTEDKSNLSPLIFRNRIRHELVPVIARLAEPFGGYDRFLLRSSALLDEIQKYDEGMRLKARKLFKKNVVASPFWLRISHAQLDALSVTEKRLLLRSALRKLGARLEKRRVLERALGQMDVRCRTIEFFDGIKAVYSCGYWFLSNQHQQRVLKDFKLSYTECGTSLHCGALGLDLVLSPKARQSLQLRAIQPGDRFRTGKLKEALLKSRIPAPERAILPVLVDPKTRQVKWFLSQANPELRVKIKKLTFPFSFLNNSV